VTYQIFISFLVYTTITAFTPGPNNILALSATSNFGIKKSKHLLLGICLGFFCVMLLCGIFSFALASILPKVTNVMKYVGAIYIIWLAWHVLKSKPSYSNETSGNSSFLSGFLLQFVNVKIILYGITALGSFVFPFYSSSYIILGFIVLLSIIGSMGTLSWAFMGSIFRATFNKHYKILNIVMALLLLQSAISLVFY